MHIQCIHWIKLKIFKEIIQLIKVHLEQIHLDFHSKVLIQQHKDIQIMINWEEALNGMWNLSNAKIPINWEFRIVSYHGEPYRNHLERNQSLPTLPTYGNQQFHPIHRSYSLNDNVLRNHNLEYNSQPFRKVAISRLPDYPRSDDGDILNNEYKLTTRRRTSAQSLSSNSGSSNSFSFQKRVLCQKCASCPTCVVQQSYTGSSDNGFGSETQRPSIFNPSRFRKLASKVTHTSCRLIYQPVG